MEGLSFGFRFDSKKSDRNSFTLQGDVYDGESDQRTSFIDQQWSTTSMRIMDDTIDLIRTPSRIDDDIRINYLVTPFPPPYTVFSIFGDRDFESEELIAYEIGWRFMPTERLSADIATFYNMSLLQKQRQSIMYYYIMCYSPRLYPIYSVRNLVSYVSARGPYI